MQKLAWSSAMRGPTPPGGLIWWLCILIGLGTGCHSAGHVVEDRFIAPERFEALAPLPEVWKLARNRRSARETDVMWRWREGGASIRVKLTPLSPRDEALPLDMLAHQVLLRGMLVERGVPELETMTRIALDEREAIAFTGAVVERPTRWLVSTVVLRSQGHLMVLSYAAKPALYEPLSGEFERLLRRFKVLLPGHFDPFLLGDAPFGAPGPFPEGWQRDRDKALAPMRPDKQAPF